MTGKTLDFHASISSPEPAGLVDGGGNDPISLGVELNFTDFILMTLQKSHTGPSEHVVDTSHSISRGGSHLVASGVEASI